MAEANKVYYYELGEGRWQGEFRFRVTDWRKLLSRRPSAQDAFLIALLHAVDRLPGKAVMHGEIACDPNEGDDGVARVDVSVDRFGLEIYRLRGYYALQADGIGVKIKIYQRFGPHGSWLESEKLATAEILEDGFLGVYYMPILGDDWVGRYRLDESRTKLTAQYDCDWGITEERMERLVPIRPSDRRELLRYETMLEVARRLEALDRTYELGDDGRALFTYAYGVVTRTIAFSLAHGDFDDPDWVVALARAFARRYMKATADYDAGVPPLGWQKVFATLHAKSLSSVAELLLCMVAHILHDLPLALLEVGLENERGVPRTADYHRMNEVLTSSIDLLQVRLAARYNPVFTTLDLLGADLDELLARAGVGQARALAWYTAQRIEDGAQREAVLLEVRDQIDDVVDRIVGRDKPRQMVSRLVHGAARALRRVPKYPMPKAEEFKRLNATPRIAKPPERDEDLLYGLHTAVGQNRRAAPFDELQASVSDALPKAPIPRNEYELTDRLASARGWERAKRLAERDRHFALRLGALVAKLDDSDGAALCAADAGISDEESEVVRSLQDALQIGLRDGFDRIHGELRRIVGLLDGVGLPATATLQGFDDLRASYDPDTELFVAEVPSLIRMPFSELRWLIEPQNWSKLIPHMLRSDWVEGPDDDRSGVIREVVNVYHPWIDDHPLVLENDLTVRQHDEPDSRVVEYALHKSIDGSLLVDEGTIRLSRIEPNASLLVVKKVLKVHGGRNPLLYSLLRTNPDGLAYLFTYWVNTVAQRFGTPDVARVA